MSGPSFHPAGPADRFTEGSITHLEIEGREIGLYHVDGTFYAIGDICTHMRARLSDGYLTGTVIECPLHFGRFDITTGKAVSAPCKADVAAYPVRVADGMVEVGLDSTETA